MVPGQGSLIFEEALIGWTITSPAFGPYWFRMVWHTSRGKGHDFLFLKRISLGGPSLTLPLAPTWAGTDPDCGGQPIKSAVPLHDVASPTVTGDGPSHFNGDKSSAIYVPASTERLNALVESRGSAYVPHEGVR